MYKYLFSFLLIVFLTQPSQIFADGHEELVSGVINAISIDDNGNVEGILIMKNDGDFVNIDIKSGENPTEFGLENIAGDRWIGNQNDNAKEVAIKLKDHQKRFAPLTVLHEEGSAKEITDMENRNVKTNLSFLFACFAVAWVAFFAYVLIINGRLRKASK
tara:strand:- start:1773 stop:2252 length:480 start_codon:yes stop_codon:yes gene_type:complete